MVSIIIPEAKLILASGSPQRATILKNHNIDFDIVPADIDEVIEQTQSTDDNVMRLATEKATAVQLVHPTRKILAADTVVEQNKTILCKAANVEQAREMIQNKSGSCERIVTGFCFLSPESFVAGSISSWVFYKKFSEEDVEKVIASKEWQGVSGALRIEGVAMSSLIEKTKGDYENIIGLPYFAISGLFEA
jgi:septum formation protein